MAGTGRETQIWDRLARRYDVIVRLFDRSYPAIRERLERDLAGRAEVLELAAGTGQFTRAIGRAAEHVLATDISPEMVRRLETTVRAAGLANVEVRVMSGYAIATDDGRFDAVVCANALHVMEEPARALAEIRRVLRPEGLLIAPTFLHGVDKLRVGVSAALGVVSPFVAHTRFDMGSLCGLIEREGFAVTESTRIPGLFPIGYVLAHAPRSSR